MLGCAALLIATPTFAQRTDITITARPIRSAEGDVSSIEMRGELTGTIASADRFSLQAPITYASVRNIADRIDSLSVRDARGPLELTVENDPVNPGGFPFYRHWRANRTVVAPVVFAYRMRPFSGTPATGPQFDLYAHGGGISTGGMALFAVPEGLGTVNTHLRWDLSQLGRGSIAASTYGEGDVDLTGPVDQIIQAYYMVGPLGRYGPSGKAGFHAHWLGQPEFDAAKEVAWAQRAYDNLRRFHRDTATSSYNVFIRAIPGNSPTMGGTALQNSFMVAVRAGMLDTSKTSPRNTIAHEMGHMWVGGLTGGGVGGTTWFNEGLNVFYTRLLLLRAGLSSVDEYARDIAASARAYYSSPFRNTSADSLGKLGFSVGVGAGSAQNVPYARGSLYFADVDAKIRAASGGKRKLDDVILALFAERRRGVQLSPAMLVDALVKEIGPSARDEFEAVIIRGETIEPVSNAFGPCFERRPATYTVNGKDVTGFEWVRVSSVPDAQCRDW